MAAASGSALGPPALERGSGLAWKWILEKLVDLPDFGITFIKEVISHVTDIEEPHCRPLLERVALRYLEEMVVANQIDADAIPLLKALTGQDSGVPVSTKVSSVKERFNKELVLRVQTEAVLAVLRKDLENGEKDWAGFKLELESVFGEEEEDNRLLGRQTELSVLLKPRNQTKAIVAAYLEKYSLNKLKNDLYTFIDEKKASFQTIFLDQLSRDFLDGKGPPLREELLEVNPGAGTVNVESSEGGKGLEAAHQKEDTGSGDVNIRKLGQKSTLEMNGDVQREDEHKKVTERRKFRRKLPIVEEGSEDEAQKELEEGHEGNKNVKSSIVPPSIAPDSPAKSLRPRDDSGRAITEWSPLKRDLLPKGEGGLARRPATQVRHEECDTFFKELGSKVMKRGSLSAHGRSMAQRQPSEAKIYVVLSDVESDAETEVVHSLSSDDKEEESAIETRQVGGHHEQEHTSARMEDACHMSNTEGRRQGRLEQNGPIEVVRKEETRHVQIERSERREERRKSSTSTPEAERTNRTEKHDKLEGEDESVPIDTQELITLLELGSDGHEEVCHKCALDGNLFWCEGCPIAMHSKCIQLLGLEVPRPEDDWFCPVCLSQKAVREAAEAEKAAAEAKAKLKAFMKESSRKRSLSEGDALLQHRQEKAKRQQKVNRDSPKPPMCKVEQDLDTQHHVSRGDPEPFVCKLERDLDMGLRPMQQSEEKPKPRKHGVVQQEDPDQPKGSLLPTLVKKPSTQNRSHGSSDKLLEEDSENRAQEPIPAKTFLNSRDGASKKASGGKNAIEVRGSLGGALQANEQILNTSSQRKQHTSWANEGQFGSGGEIPKPAVSMDPVKKSLVRVKELRASTSAERDREPESVEPVAERRRSEVHRGQGRAEQGPGTRELGTGNGGYGEVEGDKHDGDLEEDCGGKAEGARRSPFFSERRKIPGLRRKHLPWTRAEEDVLKEGVRRYSINGTHGFMWKRILEFGHGTFDPSRTDVDLKDKWRNLVRGVS